MHKPLVFVGLLFQILGSSGLAQVSDPKSLSFSKADSLQNQLTPASLCLEGELILNLYEQEHRFPFKRLIKHPDKLVTISEFEGRKRISGFDGEKFWVMNEEVINSSRSIDIISSRVQANLEGLSKFYRNNQVRSVEQTELNNSTYLKLTVITNDGYTLHYFLNTKTNLLEILQIPLEEPSTGRLNMTEYRYSDYREIDGIIYPFRKEYFFNHELKSVERIRSITVNCETDDKMFSKSSVLSVLQQYL